MTTPDAHTRREPELPDDDWPHVGWTGYVGVAFLIVALVVAVCVA